MTHIVKLSYHAYPWDDSGGGGAQLFANDDLSTPVQQPIVKGSSGVLTLPGIAFVYRIDYDGVAVAALHYEAFDYIASQFLAGAVVSAQLQISASDDLSVPVLVSVTPGASGNVKLAGIGFNPGGGPAFDVFATVIEQRLPSLELSYDGAVGTAATFRGATKLHPIAPEQGYFARWFDGLGNQIAEFGVGAGFDGPDGVIAGNVPLTPGEQTYGALYERLWNGASYDDFLLAIQPQNDAFTQGAAGQWATPALPVAPLVQVVLDAPEVLGVDAGRTFQATLLGADGSTRAAQEFVFGVPSGQP